MPNKNEVNNIFHQLGSFYPFSILTKSQILSEFKANFPKPTGKKDISEDKKRIKRIIFLKTGEGSKFQTTSKTHQYFPFQIYPSDYNKYSSNLSKIILSACCFV